MYSLPTVLSCMHSFPAVFWCILSLQYFGIFSHYSGALEYSLTTVLEYSLTTVLEYSLTMYVQPLSTPSLQSLSTPSLRKVLEYSQSLSTLSLRTFLEYSLTTYSPWVLPHYVQSLSIPHYSPWVLPHYSPWVFLTTVASRGAVRSAASSYMQQCVWWLVRAPSSS